MRINKNRQKKFLTFKAYVAHLEKILVDTSLAEKKLLNAVGVLVEKTAKAKIGHYQLAVGPFPEWDQLQQSTKDDRLRNNFSENEPLYRDGKLRDSISHTVHFTPGNKSVEIGSTSEIMIWQELGVLQNNLPPRPVLGPAMYINKPIIMAMAGETMFALFTQQIGKIK